MAQVVTQLIVDSSGAKTGVAEFEAAMAKAKRAAVDGGEATASAFERAQARWTQSLAKTDPVIKAQIALERDLARQREINANAVKLGIATQEAANAQLDRVRQQHAAYAAGIGQSGAATQKFAGQTGLARHEVVNLGRQMQDVVVSLQGGQGLGTVMLQQGSQVFDALSARGGISAGISNLVTSMRGMVTVGRLAFAGIAAAAAGAAYATSSYLDEQKNVERSLIGAGRRSASSADINRIADERSSATGLSVSETRQAALEFAKTGQIHSRVIGEMIETTRNFALVTGQSSKEAATALAGAFTNIQGIDNLNKQFNFLDASTRQTIENLLLAGRTTEAAALANDRLKGSLKAVEDTQGLAAKGWTAIANAASNATDRVGEYIAKATGLQKTSKSDRAVELTSEIERLEKMGGEGLLGGLTGRIYSGQLTQYREELEAIGAELRKEHWDAAFNKLSVSAQQAVAATNPLQSQLDIVVGKLQQLRDAQDAGINVPGLQMAVTYYEQIAQQLQNQMQAQDALAAKYPGMTAEFAKQVEALEQQNRLLKARENGTEASVSAAIAYERAIASGANSTEAAAIKALTLKNNLLQAADAAGEMEASLARAQAEIDSADSADYSRYVSASGNPNMIAGGDTGGYSRSGSQMGAGNSGRSDFEVNANPFQWWSGSWTDPELLPAGAASRAALEADDRRWAPIRERHAAIIEEMNKKLEEQTKATEANTQAITVALNPLYTQGRGSAIEFGYMHAAKGLDFIARGPTSGDQVPVHMKVNGGERVTVQTVEQQSSNDNRKTTVVNVTNNIGGSASGSRRSSRQLAQKYGQMLAALS